MNVLENHKDPPQEKHLSVRGNFRLVRLDQEKATTASCKSVMSELSHLLPSTLFQHDPRDWRTREWERRNLAEMDILMIPGKSPGPQQGRGKHWIDWIWDGVDTWLTWPCETQSDRMYGVVAKWCRKWRWRGVCVKTARGGGWSQLTSVSLWSQPCVPGNVTWWHPDSHAYGIHRWCLCELMES